MRQRQPGRALVVQVRQCALLERGRVGVGRGEPPIALLDLQQLEHLRDLSDSGQEGNKSDDERHYFAKRKAAIKLECVTDH
jgi:hypothetical protein